MRHYFDWAATAPPGEVRTSLSRPAPPFGNPSSRHLEGRKAREALEEARSRCAAVLGVSPKQLYFTSGGTESNTIPLQSLLLRKNAAALVSSVEHPSVRENALVLERLGLPLVFVGVEKDGRVSGNTLEAALAKMPGLRFAAIMGVNNETGAVMDLAALVKRIRGGQGQGAEQDYGQSQGRGAEQGQGPRQGSGQSQGPASRQGPPVHVHSDLVQALGKIPLDISGWDLDSASFSAHKIGGPRGVGLLWLRRTMEVLGTGGGQEGGIRPGTENTAGALAMAECMEEFANPEAVQAGYAAAAKRWSALIRELRTLDRCTLIPEDRRDEDPRFSPWILQAGFRGIPGEVMARALDDAGFAVSTGSACSSRDQKRPVLEAMGIKGDRSLEGVRFSQGWSTSIEDIEALVGAIRKILEIL